MKTRVMIVDDHTSVRQMLGILIPAVGAFDVVAEACSGVEAIRLHRELKPDLVVLDLALADLNGVGVLQHLREEARPVRTLVFCGTVHRRVILAALHARPHGFVSKRDPWETFIKALHLVNDGCSYFTPFATRVFDEMRAESGSPQLTSRELAVLQMIAESNSNKEIAKKLVVSIKTVEHHRSNLMAKLGARDVAALTRYAAGQGLIPV